MPNAYVVLCPRPHPCPVHVATVYRNHDGEVLDIGVNVCVCVNGLGISPDPESPETKFYFCIFSYICWSRAKCCLATFLSGFLTFGFKFLKSKCKFFVVVLYQSLEFTKHLHLDSNSNSHM